MSSHAESHLIWGQVVIMKIQNQQLKMNQAFKECFDNVVFVVEIVEWKVKALQSFKTADGIESWNMTYALLVGQTQFFQIENFQLFYHFWHVL